MTAQEFYSGERIQNAIKCALGVVLLAVVAWFLRGVEVATFAGGLLQSLLALALVLVVRGAFGYRHCTRVLANLPPAPREETRVRGIERWWVPRQMIWASLTIVGIALGSASGLPRWEGTGLGLVIFAAVSWIFDGFARARCDAYGEKG